MKPYRLRAAALAVLLNIGCLAPALADKHVVEEVVIRPGAQGLEEKKGTVETWIGADKFARIDGLNNVTTIVRRDLGKMYIVLHDQKVTIESDLPFALPEDLQTLFEEIKTTWRLNHTDQRRQIGKWNTNKVELLAQGIINIDVEMWINNETGIDTRSYHSMLGEALKSSPLFSDLAIQLASLGSSFSIATRTTVSQMGLTTTTEALVTSITDEPGNRQVYQPPDGYKTEPLNFRTYLALVRDRYRP